MMIYYRIWKVVIENFRGIDKLEVEFSDGTPTIIIESNNAEKSIVLNAIALAFGSAGTYKWQPSEFDFHCNESGKRSTSLAIKVHFRSDNEMGYPAVRGVGAATLVHGVQVKARILKDGRFNYSRT